MSLSTNFPTVGPVLNLDFVNNQTLDPRITFTRASTATYYDAQTSAKAEENLLLQSQAFDDATNWAKINTSVTANTSTAPDGTTTADTITASAGAAIHNVQQPNSVTGQYTASVFAKAGTHNFIQIFQGSSGNFFADFDLSLGTVGTVGASTSASITNVGSGWYRCSIVISPSSSSSIRIALVTSSTSAYNESWTAAGTETVLLWGAQLEQRSSVTAYTATTTAPITNYIPVLLTAQNNIPRFDFNPVTRVPQGLLIEESRTNLALQSEDFATSWAASNSSVSVNETVAPNGTITADKLVENTTPSAGHFVGQSISTATTAHTLSVYMKRAGRDWGIVYASGANVGNYFDLVNGVVGASFVGAPTSSSIQNVGNGWFRCSITFTATATTTARFYTAAANGNATYTGDGFSGVFIWGAQLEAGSFPTSYIPTVASTVARSADLANMTGTNFSSWFNAGEGTIYSEAELINGAAVVAAGTTNFTVTWVSDGGSTNFITQRYNAAASPSLQYAGLVNNVTQWAFLSAGLPLGSFPKNASVYKFNDIAQSVNAGTVGTDTSATLPVVNRLDIGVGNSGAQPLNGHVRKISYYNYRMTNAQLQALTRS